MVDLPTEIVSMEPDDEYEVALAMMFAFFLGAVISAIGVWVRR